MTEFNLYNRISNGDLRPNLEGFHSESGLDSLEREFYSKRVKITDENIDSILSSFQSDFHGFKAGDKIMAEFNEDDKNPKITFEKIANPDEEELINIDIPPPIDRKTEIFHRIIEDEYNRIKIVFSKKLEKSNDFNEIKTYALRHIQIAKKLAKDSHILEKKLKKENLDDWNNPNTLVLYSLKRHLIYSILDIQELFAPIINLKFQNEYDLEDELFEMYYSKMKSKSKIIHKSLDKRHLDKLYEEIGSNPSFEKKKELFLNKLKDQNKIIEEASQSKYGIIKYQYDSKILYQKELGKILDEYYTDLLIQNTTEIGVLRKYEKALKTVTELKVKPNSLETISLKETDFFERIEIELNSLKELIDISGTLLISENILKDLISFLIILQSRKHLNLKEDQWNDYLSDLLRAKQYYVSDQTRNGRSGSDNQNNYNSGELDISIRDMNNNGVIKTIIETLQITSCGEKNEVISNHINKLLNRYDTSGNKENFIIVFAKANNYNSLWGNYIKYVNNLNFISNNIEVIDNEEYSKSDIRIARNIIVREEKELKLYHLFVNMNKN